MPALLRGKVHDFASQENQIVQRAPREANRSSSRTPPAIDWAYSRQTSETRPGHHFGRMRVHAESNNEGLRIQPKLQIGPVDDPLEREADHVAETVMRMPDREGQVLQRKCACGGSCPKCEEEANGQR
jgi:hypothetical protein